MTDNVLVERSDTEDPPSESVGPLNEHGHRLISVATESPGVPHTQLSEGETCPVCARTVPFKRKPTSPTSKTRAYKVPVDELDAHNEVLEAAAEHIGAKGQPFAQFKTVTAALAVLLQDEGARGLHG